ncbi:DUF5610 domain-containing protein [Marinobacterium sp. YM272]|uniref:DUF5610 domain-containing protein n=1 Tax=Marinobacterium sp. YM272 TaxID=3421654 RepID=UPI003D7F61F2
MVSIYPSSVYGQPIGTTLNSSTSGNTASVGDRSTDALLSKLAENIPGMGAEELRSLNAEDFSPEKVATRISDFVAAGLEAARSRGASDEKLQSMYDAALSGVQKGFDDAREVLENLQLLDGQIAEQVDETESLTFEALNALAPGTDGISSGMGTRMSIIERFQNAEEMQLTIFTQDGDEVTINFGRDQNYQSGYAAATDGQGNSAAVFSLSRSEYSEYSFTVSGSLDEGEIEALQNLVKDVSGLADEFFNGDVQKAFEQSGTLNFDAAELASMQLDMSYTRQYASISSYEQVSQLEQTADKPGRRLGHLMKEVAQSFGAPSLGNLLAPGQLGRDLFEALVNQDSRYIEAPAEEQERYADNLRTLLDAVAPVEAPDAEPGTAPDS